MSLRLTFLVICSATFLAAVTVGFCSQGDPAPDASNPDHAALQRQNGPSSLLPPDATSEAEHTRIEAITPNSERVVIDVRDIQGASIPGAKLLTAHAAAPQVRLSRGLLGTADVDGRIETPRETVVNAKKDVLYVWHGGFLPRPLLELLPEQTVVLEQGHTWGVRCVTESGEPVPDVAVAITALPDGQAARRSAQLDTKDDEVDADPLVPGPQAAAAVYRAATAADGTAWFHGLAAGSYTFRFAHDAMRIVRGPRGMSGHTVPGPELTLVLAPCVGAALRVEGDDVLAWNAIRSRTQFERRSRFQVHGGPPEQKLRARFPDSIVFVDLPAEELRVNDRLPELTVWILLAHSGWSRETIVMCPVGEVLPTIVEARPDGEPVALEVFCDADPPLPTTDAPHRPALQVMTEYEGHTIETIIELGRSVRLPPGTYVVAPMSPYVADALEIPATLHIQKDGANHFLFSRRKELVPCHVEFLPPRGMSLPTLNITFADDDGVSMNWDWWVPEDATELRRFSPWQWFPKGPLQILVRAPGLPDTSVTNLVQPGPEGSCLLRVELEAP